MGINVEDAFETEGEGYVSTDPVTKERVFYMTSGSGAPTGSAPINTWYFRRDTQTIYYKFDTGDNDWRQVRSEDITFTAQAATYRAATNTVKAALDELRLLKLYKPTLTASTLNGTLSLTNLSNSLNIITGSATGYSVNLPDATTLMIGSSFLIVNTSSESITLKDGSGSALLTVIAGDVVEGILEDKGTDAGTWITITTSGTATGITSYVVSSNTTFVTSSSTDDLITGFTVTPVSGRYSVLFSSDIDISQNNRIAEAVVYAGGVVNENTRRSTQGVSSNFNATLQTVGEVTVNGSQAVDVRVNITSGNLTVGQRSLILVRLGSA